MWSAAEGKLAATSHAEVTEARHIRPADTDAGALPFRNTRPDSRVRALGGLRERVDELIEVVGPDKARSIDAHRGKCASLQQFVDFGPADVELFRDLRDAVEPFDRHVHCLLDRSGWLIPQKASTDLLVLTWIEDSQEAAG